MPSRNILFWTTYNLRNGPVPSKLEAFGLRLIPLCENTFTFCPSYSTKISLILLIFLVLILLLCEFYKNTILNCCLIERNTTI